MCVENILPSECELHLFHNRRRHLTKAVMSLPNHRSLFSNLFNKNKTTENISIPLVENLKSESEKNKSIQQEFLNRVEVLLSFCKINISYELNLDELINASEIEGMLDQEIKKITMITEMIKNNKMNLNLHMIQLRFKNIGNSLEVDFSFELKNNGLQWAIFFTKYMQPNFMSTYPASTIILAELSGANSRTKEKYLFRYTTKLNVENFIN